jgi:hypothetical protein
MTHLRHLTLVWLFLVVPFAAAGDKGKATDNTWAKIISELLTPEQSKKGLDFQQNAAVKPDTMLSYAAKDLGAKLSLRIIQEKYGKPSKTEEYRVKDGDKILTRKEYHYPPIYFVAEKDSDDVFLIGAPKRLWSGPGILENARAALKK